MAPLCAVLLCTPIIIAIVQFIRYDPYRAYLDMYYWHRSARIHYARYMPVRDDPCTIYGKLQWFALDRPHPVSVPLFIILYIFALYAELLELLLRMVSSAISVAVRFISSRSLCASCIKFMLYAPLGAVRQLFRCFIYVVRVVKGG